MAIDLIMITKKFNYNKKICTYFLFKVYFNIIYLMLIIFLILLTNVNAFIRINNNVFIDENDNERIFHGINTGNELNITKMKENGFDVHCMIAENFALPIKDFDIILMNDIIEHLSNPGLSLICISRHLKKRGNVVISTPNNSYIINMLKAIF